MKRNPAALVSLINHKKEDLAKTEAKVLKTQPDAVTLTEEIEELEADLKLLYPEYAAEQASMDDAMDGMG